MKIKFLTSFLAFLAATLLMSSNANALTLLPLEVSDEFSNTDGTLKDLLNIFQKNITKYVTNADNQTIFKPIFIDYLNPQNTAEENQDDLKNFQSVLLMTNIENVEARTMRIALSKKGGKDPAYPYYIHSLQLGESIFLTVFARQELDKLKDSNEIEFWLWNGFKTHIFSLTKDALLDPSYPLFPEWTKLKDPRAKNSLIYKTNEMLYSFKEPKFIGRLNNKKGQIIEIGKFTPLVGSNSLITFSVEQNGNKYAADPLEITEDITLSGDFSALKKGDFSISYLLEGSPIPYQKPLQLLLEDLPRTARSLTQTVVRPFKAFLTLLLPPPETHVKIKKLITTFSDGETMSNYPQGEGKTNEEAAAKVTMEAVRIIKQTNQPNVSVVPTGECWPEVRRSDGIKVVEKDVDCDYGWEMGWEDCKQGGATHKGFFHVSGKGPPPSQEELEKLITERCRKVTGPDGPDPTKAGPASVLVVPS